MSLETDANTSRVRRPIAVLGLLRVTRAGGRGTLSVQHVTITWGSISPAVRALLMLTAIDFDSKPEST